MTVTKCLDTSAWLAYYFAESATVKEVVESNLLIVTSALSVFEIKKKLLSLRKDVQELLQFVAARSELIPLTVPLAEQAADVAVANRLGAMDALIYTTAQSRQAELVTGDNDFRGLPNVHLLK